jgi:hypothetical protein
MVRSLGPGRTVASGPPTVGPHESERADSDAVRQASFADTETINGPGRRKTTMAEGNGAGYLPPSNVTRPRMNRISPFIT